MIEWTAFIRQARIDAPPHGCNYGTGFQFGGDSRGFGAHDQRYRIRINGSWDFTDRKVGESVLVGRTKVYRKKDGKLVATRTASASGNQVRDAGGSNGNTAYLALRMAGTNPFCRSGGAIAGQMVIKVAAGGSWTVLSGSHRQMPAHEIYIYRNGQRNWFPVHRKQEASVLCLIGGGCPRAAITGSGVS